MTQKLSIRRRRRLLQKQRERSSLIRALYQMPKIAPWKNRNKG